MSVPARRGTAELGDLAGEIRREHGATQDAFQSAVVHAIRCGELLIEAKAALPHGSWGDWISENFPASTRTAQGYMRLARAEDAQGLAHLGIEGALRELAAPKQEQDGPTPVDRGGRDRDRDRVREHDAILAYLFGCETPAPERFRRAIDLMVELQKKRDYLDSGAWMEPPPSYDEDERTRGLRWIHPERGRAIPVATKVVTEIMMLGTEINALVPEWDGEARAESEKRGTALLTALEERAA